MQTYTFKIDGMTCQSCVKTITEKFQQLVGGEKVNIDLANKKADITSDTVIKLGDLKKSLADYPKYAVSFYDDDQSTDQSTLILKDEGYLKTYKPLIVVFAYILVLSLAFQISLEKFSLHLFMNHLMAGFFIGLSFFKLLDVKSFSKAFSNYDPIAKKWSFYGIIYPFLELTLGALYIANKGLYLANSLTVIILLVTTFGVYEKIKSKSKFQCACLGAGFNLPLSYVTVAENLIMVLMALISLSSVF